MHKDAKCKYLAAFLLLTGGDGPPRQETMVCGRSLRDVSLSTNVGDMRFLDEKQGERLLMVNRLLIDPVERGSDRRKAFFSLRRVEDISTDEDVRMRIKPHFKIQGAYWLFKHRKVA